MVRMRGKTGAIFCGKRYFIRQEEKGNLAECVWYDNIPTFQEPHGASKIQGSELGGPRFTDEKPRHAQTVGDGRAVSIPHEVAATRGISSGVCHSAETTE